MTRLLCVGIAAAMLALAGCLPVQYTIKERAQYYEALRCPQQIYRGECP